MSNIMENCFCTSVIDIIKAHWEQIYGNRTITKLRQFSVEKAPINAFSKSFLYLCNWKVNNSNKDDFNKFTMKKQISTYLFLIGFWQFCFAQTPSPSIETLLLLLCQAMILLKAISSLLSIPISLNKRYISNQGGITLKKEVLFLCTGALSYPMR
jgi:hypothetical protein